MEPTTVPATEPTTEPPVEDKVYSIAGNNADIFGAEWDASNTATDMTKGDDGLYTITFPDVQPSDKVVEFKVVTNHSWDESYGDETGANVQFIVKNPCNVTVTFDEETKKINVFADVDDGIEYPINPTVEVVRAVGNGQDNWLNDVNWDPDDDINKMQQVAPGVYQIVFDDIDEDLNYQIKFAVNGGWSFNFGAPEDGFVAPNGEAFDASFNGKNIYVHVDNDGSKVIAVLDLSNFDYSTKLGAKATITVVAPAAPVTEPPVETTVPETEPPVETTVPVTEPPVETTVPVTEPAKLHVDTTSNFFEAKDLGDKADKAQVAKVQEGVDKVKEALKSNDTETIKKAMEEAQKPLYEMSAAAYQQAQAAGAAQGAEGAQQAGAQQDAKNDDDVVDAEYTEVKDDKK